MPATDYNGSSTASFASFGRSILTMRRDQQIHSMESPIEKGTSHENELEAFQRHVAERLQDLSPEHSDAQLLSIPWIRMLLDVYVSCQDEFRVILSNNKGILNKPPMDRFLAEFYDRSVKALDVCNATRDGIEKIRQWQGKLEIVLSALDNQRSMGEGQFRRAKKALIDLAIQMLDEKESTPALAHRHRSFGRHTNVPKDNRTLAHHRSLSWSVSRSWSAARQLNAIANNLAAPRPNEIVATGGLVIAVYTMSHVLLFVMWALVAAIPCQDRGLQTHFYVPKQYIFAAPILSLHEKILEESRRRDRRNACGLLREIQEIERCARHMNELTDSVQFPLTDEKEAEVRQRMQEVRQVYESVMDGLGPLEHQVREVFKKITRSRTDGYDSLG